MNVDIVQQLRWCGDSISNQAANTIELHRTNARKAMDLLASDTQDANTFHDAMTLLGEIAGTPVLRLPNGGSVTPQEFLRRFSQEPSNVQ
jgi:hypothetical protein